MLFLLIYHFLILGKGLELACKWGLCGESLHCKLAPVHDQVYENGLLYLVTETGLLSRLIKVCLKETVERFHVLLFGKQNMVG